MLLSNTYVHLDIMIYQAATDFSQIHKAKAEKARERVLKEEMDAKRAKTKAARERRQERVQNKRAAIEGEEEQEEATQ